MHHVCIMNGLFFGQFLFDITHIAIFSSDWTITVYCYLSFLSFS